MKAVIRLERGHLVLPGLDAGMDEDAWDDLADEDDETLVAHPQYPLRQLMDALAISRSQITIWQGTRDAAAQYDAEKTGRLDLLRGDASCPPDLSMAAYS